MSCIFIGQPDCITCLENSKLQCLRDHQHLIVSPDGKRELIRLLKAEINSPERYKTKSGEEQRKYG